ncbi:MAG: response regulator [Anaerolineae bacterium]|nr:MAG: response regulator [Anaerolineae bacterium]
MPRILVVDDSPTMRKMIMAALRPLQAEFGEAGNGLEAIEQLALKRYQAMTLDLNMPDMHGLEVLRYVRQLASYEDMPVVVISTRGDEASLQQALQLGANRYLVKPFQPAELLETLQTLLPDITRS